jgi:hypothetical protein
VDGGKFICAVRKTGFFFTGFIKGILMLTSQELQHPYKDSGRR